jgi:hypothetical protein
MQFHISINAQIGGQEFNVCETSEVDTEEWDIEGVASEHLELLTLRMKSALSPCFWDHASPTVPGVYLPEKEEK